MVINKNYLDCAISLKLKTNTNIKVFIYTIYELNKKHTPKKYLNEHIDGYITDSITKSILLLKNTLILL